MSDVANRRAQSAVSWEGPELSRAIVLSLNGAENWLSGLSQGPLEATDSAGCRAVCQRRIVALQAVDPGG